MQTRLSKVLILLLVSSVIIPIVFTACSDDDNPVASVDKTIDILFMSDRDGVDRVYGMNASGSYQVPLVSSGPVYKDPVWSPDGTRFAAVRSEQGFSHITVVNVDSLTSIDFARTAAELSNPTWSADGTKIAFAVGSGIYTVTVSSGDLAPITNHQGDQFPAWHPDGSKISCAYFNSNTTSWETRWFLADGSFTTTKIYTTQCGGRSGWASDGARYFRCGTTAINTQMNFEENGSGIGAVSSPDPIDCPSWLSDASGVLMSVPLTSQGSYDLFLWNAGKSAVWLTSEAGNNVQPDCNEAMTQIVFCSDRDGNEEIYRMNFDGTKQVNLSRNAARDWSPKYRPGM